MVGAQNVIEAERVLAQLCAKRQMVAQVARRIDIAERASSGGFVCLSPLARLDQVQFGLRGREVALNACDDGTRRHQEEDRGRGYASRRGQARVPPKPFLDSLATTQFRCVT